MRSIESRTATVNTVMNMEPLDKLTIYMESYIRHLCLKHDFVVETNSECVSFKYLWARGTHKSFDEYCDPDVNFKETDNGEDWSKSGWAERFTLTETGIFRDIWLFNRLSINQ